MGAVYGSVEEARAELVRDFGEEWLASYVRGKRVLDFGAGYGHHVRALLDLGAREVWGVDIQAHSLEFGRKLLRDEPRARLINSVVEPDWAEGQFFDAVLSLNSMEHIEDPGSWLRRWREWLTPGGRVLIGFGPLWLSPMGSHMGMFTSLPWVNVLFPERTVLRVRSDYRSDGATRYEEITGGLNKMTLRKFHHCVRHAGLTPERIRTIPVRGLPLVTRIPVVNEFLTQGLVAVLRDRAERPAGPGSIPTAG